MGCAVLFIAASDDEISSDVDYLVSFGGYYDTKNVLLYMTTGFYKEKGEWKRYPHEKTISKIFLEKNTHMVKEDERAALYRIIEEGPKDELLKGLSGEAKNLVGLIYNRNKDAFFRLYDKIDPAAKKIFEDIAPKNYLKKIKADCYIAHSVPDFGFFSHVERKFRGFSLKKIFFEYIPDTIKFYIFIYRMLML